MKLQIVSLAALLAGLASAEMNKMGIGSRHPYFQLYEGCTDLARIYMYACPPQYFEGMGYMLNMCNCYSDQFLATYNDCITRANGDAVGAREQLVMMCSSMRPDITVATVLAAAAAQEDNFISPSQITNSTAQLDNAVYFSQLEVDNAYRAYISIETNKYKSTLYGAALLCYFGGIFLFATICNFVKSYMPGFAKKVSNTGPILYIRKKVANPALAGNKHSVPFIWGPYNVINMSLPTRSQFVILMGYLIMLFVLHFPNYDVFDGNIVYTTKWRQLTKLVADRTGLLATVQLPLLYVLASRNSIIVWCTGWSYDTMNVYHRWVARSIVLDSFLHAVIFTANYRNRGDFWGHWQSYFMIWGVVATICSCFILFFALRHFRARSYEVFLFGHWVLVCFFTAGTWKHLAGRGFTVWMYPCVALWVFDRAWRIFRMMLSSVTSVADIELDKSKEFVKVKIDYSYVWGASPGNYAFIYFLLPFLKFWENHPFSCFPSPVPGEEQLLCFVMKVQAGKTKQIAHYLANKQGGRARVPVLVEGPYGHTFPIDKSDTIVLVAGGIGITAVYSYAAKLKAQGSKKHIVLLWITRTHSNIDVMRDEINHLVKGCCDGIDVQLYITDEDASALPVDSLSDSYDEKKAASDSELAASSESFISAPVTYGIPDLRATVAGYVAEAQGSIGFLVCGPPIVNDIMRSAVTENMDKGKGRVDLFVEAYNW